jgi:hypothetical protein
MLGGQTRRAAKTVEQQKGEERLASGGTVSTSLLLRNAFLLQEKLAQHNSGGIWRQTIA